MREYKPSCEKTCRMLKNYYHRLLMQTSDMAARELYIHILRHLDRQIEAHMQKEVMAYST